MDDRVSFMYPSVLDPQKSSIFLLWKTHHSPDDAPVWSWKSYMSQKKFNCWPCASFWRVSSGPPTKRQGGNMLGKNEKARIRVPTLPLNRRVSWTRHVSKPRPLISGQWGSWLRSPQGFFQLQRSTTHSLHHKIHFTPLECSISRCQGLWSAFENSEGPTDVS